MKQIAIAGIHTGIGKTIASAIICEALHADYWKPVQAGDLEGTDTDTVRRLISNSESHLHTEAFRLSMPVSPHLAAKAEGKEINIEALTPPLSDRTLIIETAGGILSPLNDRQTNLDFLRCHQLPVILVSDHYLGSINHTLLSCEVLRQHHANLTGILFIGAHTPASEEYILRYTGCRCLGSIPHLDPLNRHNIAAEAQRLSDSLKQHLYE
jgi:dethiobiotin synthetase